MQKTSFKRIRRWLWGFFVFSTIRSKLMFLAGIALFVISIGTITGHYAFSLSFGEAFWWTWTHMLDAGFLVDDRLGWGQKALGSLFCLSGLALIGVGLLVVATEAAISAFEKAVRGRVPYHMKSHTVIAGSGAKVSHFVQVLNALDSSKSDRDLLVVVPSERLLYSMRESLGKAAMVTVGQIWKPETQESLDLHDANRLLILDNFGGDSGHMLETIRSLADNRGKKAQKKGKPQQEMKVYAEVEDRHLLLALQASVRLIRGRDANMEALLMNMANASARIALRENPLDCAPIQKGIRGKVVLVVMGWSPFGDALFQQVLRIGHYAVQPTRVILVGAQGDELQRQIRKTAPGLEQGEYIRSILSVEFCPGSEPCDLGLIQEDMVTLALCGEKPDVLLAQAIQISEAPFPGLRQIYLELPDGSGYWGALKERAFKEREIKIVPVGSHSKAFELAEKLDKTARKAHQRYLEEKGAKRVRTPDGLGYIDESDYDWEDLDEIRRGWNRTPVDHAAIKLRALADFYGLSRPIGDSPVLDPSLRSRISEIVAHVQEGRVGHRDDLELLSCMEHNRWVGEKIAEGWQFAQEKEPARKLSPYLAPYESLAEEVKQFDRNQVAGQLDPALEGSE